MAAAADVPLPRVTLEHVTTQQVPGTPTQGSCNEGGTGCTYASAPSADVAPPPKDNQACRDVPLNLEPSQPELEMVVPPLHQQLQQHPRRLQSQTGQPAALQASPAIGGGLRVDLHVRLQQDSARGKHMLEAFQVGCCSCKVGRLLCCPFRSHTQVRNAHAESMGPSVVDVVVCAFLRFLGCVALCTSTAMSEYCENMTISHHMRQNMSTPLTHYYQRRSALMLC